MMLHTNETPYGVKHVCIIFDKVDGYIKKNVGAKYLALFHSDEKCERIFDRIIDLIMLKRILHKFILLKYIKIKSYLVILKLKNVNFSIIKIQF